MKDLFEAWNGLVKRFYKLLICNPHHSIYVIIFVNATIYKDSDSRCSCFLDSIMFGPFSSFVK